MSLYTTGHDDRNNMGANKRIAEGRWRKYSYFFVHQLSSVSTSQTWDDKYIQITLT